MMPVSDRWEVKLNFTKVPTYLSSHNFDKNKNDLMHTKQMLKQVKQF